MWDIGPDKILIIVVVALLVVGPKRIPGMARSLGKAFRGFRDATSGVQRYQTPIVAKGRIFVVGDREVYAFTTR